MIYVGISAAHGIFAENNNAVLASDVKGFLYFLMLPAFLCVMRNRSRLEFGMKCMILGSLILAVIICGAECIHNLYDGFYLWVSQYNEVGFLSVGYVSHEILRVFSSSTPYLVVSSCFCIYFQCKNEHFHFRYGVALGLFLCAILFSFTRSVFLSFFCSFIIVVIFSCFCGYGKRLAKQFFVSLVVASLCLGGFYLAFRADFLSFALSRSVGTEQIGDTTSSQSQIDSSASGETDSTPTEENDELDTVLDARENPGKYLAPPDTSDSQSQVDSYLSYSQLVSDKFRQYTISSLLEKIRSAPVFGHGLGATLEFREFNEYFYLDIWMKMGILGLFLYFLPAFLCGYRFLRSVPKLRVSGNHYDVLFPAMFFAGFFGICVFSFFNPYLNAVLGETMYCLGAAALWHSVD